MVHQDNSLADDFLFSSPVRTRIYQSQSFDFFGQVQNYLEFSQGNLKIIIH